MPCQLQHFFERGIGSQLRFVGMNADSRIDKGILLGQSNSAINVRRPIADADGNDRVDTGSARTGDHFLAIAVVLTAFEMCVRIYKHSRPDLGPQTSDLQPGGGKRRN